jgi:WD40 repeat protein
VLPDGRPVAVTGGRDATVRVWDLAAARPLGHLLHTVESVTALAVSGTSPSEVSIVLAIGGPLAAVTLRLDEIGE